MAKYDYLNNYLNSNMNTYKSGGMFTSYNVGGTHEQNPNGGIPLGGDATVEQGETSVNLDQEGAPTAKPTGSKYIFSDRQVWTPEDVKMAGLPAIRKPITAGEYMAKLNEKFSDRSGSKPDKETLNTFTKRATKLAEQKRMEREQLERAMQLNSQQVAPENTEVPEGMEEFDNGGEYYSRYFNQAANAIDTSSITAPKMPTSLGASGADAAGAGATSGSLGNAGGYIQAAGMAFDMYQTAKSGNTSTNRGKAIGGGAAKGAISGASAGTAFMPGIGTAVGAVGGALAGGISGYFGSEEANRREVAEVNKATRQINAGMPNSAAWTGLATAPQGVATAHGGYITSKSYANGGMTNPPKYDPRKPSEEVVNKAQRGIDIAQLIAKYSRKKAPLAIIPGTMGSAFGLLDSYQHDRPVNPADVIGTIPSGVTQIMSETLDQMSREKKLMAEYARKSKKINPNIVLKEMAPVIKDNFDNGGPINPPVYVKSKNDPKYQAYQDSLKLFNSYKDLRKKLKEANYKNLGNINDYFLNKVSPKLTDKELIKEANRDKSKDTSLDKIKYKLTNDAYRTKPSKEGNLYKTLDFYPGLINEDLGYQYFSDKIKPLSEEVYRRHRFSGDGRVVKNYSNVNPKQKVIVDPTKFINMQESPKPKITGSTQAPPVPKGKKEKYAYPPAYRSLREYVDIEESPKPKKNIPVKAVSNLKLEPVNIGNDDTNTTVKIQQPTRVPKYYNVEDTSNPNAGFGDGYGGTRSIYRTDNPNTLPKADNRVVTPVYAHGGVIRYDDGGGYGPDGRFIKPKLESWDDEANSIRNFHDALKISPNTPGYGKVLGPNTREAYTKFKTDYFRNIDNGYYAEALKKNPFKDYPVPVHYDTNKLNLNPGEADVLGLTPTGLKKNVGDVDMTIEGKPFVQPTGVQAGFENYYNTNNPVVTPPPSFGSRAYDTAKGIAGKAGTWLDENKNSMLRAYPILSNIMERDKIKKPIGHYGARLNDAYNVPVPDEAAALRDINAAYNNKVRALGQMGGSQGQQRAALLGLGAQENQLRSQTYAGLENARMQRAMQEQQFKTQIAQYNAQKSDQDRDLMDRDIAKYDELRSKFTSQIAGDIGQIGLEQDRMDQVANMYGYDRKGKYLVNRQTGKVATPEEISKIRASVAAKEETKTAAFGGYITRKPSKY